MQPCGTNLKQHEQVLPVKCQCCLDENMCNSLEGDRENFIFVLHLICKRFQDSVASCRLLADILLTELSEHSSGHLSWAGREVCWGFQGKLWDWQLCSFKCKGVWSKYLMAKESSCSSLPLQLWEQQGKPGKRSLLPSSCWNLYIIV